jgi:1-acyl-sn-glycerol-3-phosphate acyltransferase
VTRGQPIDPLKARSARLFWLFGWYLRFLFWRKFDAVRVSHAGEPPPAIVAGLSGPVIVYSNHPSWWDPTLYMLLAAIAFRRHASFGPMQSAALGKYAFFRKLGVFPIDPTIRAGAAEFLNVANRVLSAPRGMLWVTAEGAFVDPRVRPVRLRPGIAHLARRIPNAVMLPLAIEYGFWNESHPGVFLRFGTPIPTGRHLDVAAWHARLEQELATTMDALAQETIARDPAAFRSLLRGGAGLGGIYDWYRRAKWLLRGRWFDTSHEGSHR